MNDPTVIDERNPRCGSCSHVHPIYTASMVLRLDDPKLGMPRTYCLECDCSSYVSTDVNVTAAITITPQRVLTTEVLKAAEASADARINAHYDACLNRGDNTGIASCTCTEPAPDSQSLVVAYLNDYLTGSVANA